MTIKSKNNIQKDISIPDRYSSNDREAIGRLIVERILRRTSNGVSSRGTAFKYVKSSEHSGGNLKDSGDMLAMLEVVSHRGGSIKVGYEDTGSVEANQAEGNQIGSYGGSAKSSRAKPFIGISNDELDLILEAYDQTSRSDREDNVTDSFITNILSNQGL